MKRFRFTLQSVAVVRAHRDLLAREALAAAARVRRQAEEDFLAARRRMEELETVMAAGRSGTFRAADEVAFHQAYCRDSATTAGLARGLAAAQAEVARHREACIAANRELKIVNRLEEKARSAHHTEVLRAEQRELDEAAGFGALNRSSSA